jgi:uncharacterized membrane protein SpoIIM required for sporulation
MNIKNEIREAFVDNKKIFLALLILFIIGLAIGWIMADDIAPVLMPILKEALVGEDNSIDAFYILSHNLQASVITVLASIFFGIYPFISISANGFVIGFMGGYTAKSMNELAMYLILIIPHGILEVPALFTSAASGILLFLFIFRMIKDKYHGNTWNEAFENNKKTLKQLIILYLISVVLLTIAAMIEGFITPQLGNMLSMHLNGQALF